MTMKIHDTYLDVVAGKINGFKVANTYILICNLGDKMEFSVLMSVYEKDNAKYLQQAIVSISLGQTIKPRQIVIVKDGPVSVEINQVINSCTKNCSEIEYTVIEKEQNGICSSLKYRA